MTLTLVSPMSRILRIPAHEQAFADEIVGSEGWCVAQMPGLLDTWTLYGDPPDWALPMMMELRAPEPWVLVT